MPFIFFDGIIYSLKYCWVWPRVSSLWKAAWLSLCQLPSSSHRASLCWALCCRRTCGEGVVLLSVKTLWPTQPLALVSGSWPGEGSRVFFGPLSHCLHQLETHPGSRVPKPREVLVPCLVIDSTPGWSPLHRTR